MAADTILNNNPAFLGMASMDRLTFLSDGLEQDLLLISSNARAKKHPLVVFLQGSGWTSPNRFYQLPQLCCYAREGLAVALITHRDATQGHPFPAYLRDAKTAIRFLRSKAEELWLDTERVAFFGTSSGGNTALLVALTGDEPRYKTPEYAEVSDAVCCAVDCFGPSDLLDFEGSPLTGNLKALLKGGAERAMDILSKEALLEGNEMLGVMLSLFGKQNPLQVLEDMSPLRQIREGATYPPFLLLHGDADPVVPISQSRRMHAALKQAGASSTLVEITGAEHEGTFWSDEVHSLILGFLKKHLA